MSLISTHSISKAFGSNTLFKDISITIGNERIGLLGPNGAGKSTFLKILMGQETPDTGFVSKKQGLRVGYASQLPEFEDVSLEKILVPDDDLDKLTRARILLGKAQFTDFEQTASQLSGGWKKRLDIVRALMAEPELLLLDEPTNHLDLEGILWLEKFLMRENIAYLIVSHDRYFLENVCNKIIELNKCYPQGVFISEGNMSDYMEHKKSFLEAQAQRQRGLASVVRDEIDWLRRSPKARTTKSRSRINKAYELMDELSQIQQRNKVQKVNIEFTASERETRRLLVGKNLTKSLGGKHLFKGVDVILSPGTRLGIAGKNGTGKTTLLKVLAGMIPLDMGTVKLAEDLKLVYFDQHREQLPDDITLRRALSPNSDNVNYRGQSIHVNGWAKKFLFSPDRLELPVGCLSGGERARILIAKLMLEPADILFLDEPTNDLDIQTLEVIEENLNDFPGAIVLISHDRCLMDRVCTQILGLGQGNEQQFYADYAQWEEASLKTAPVKKEESAPPVKKTTTPKKLSYKEQKELEDMENAVMRIEEQIASLEQQADSADPQKALEVYNKLAEAHKTQEMLYARWQELESKSK